MGSVTALAAVKSLVVASEFLGSITVSRVQPNSLVPLQVRAVDRSGVFAQATLPLSDTEFLVAAHPFGLVLLKRCRRAVTLPDWTDPHRDPGQLLMRTCCMSV